MGNTQTSNRRRVISKVRHPSLVNVTSNNVLSTTSTIPAAAMAISLPLPLDPPSTSQTIATTANNVLSEEDQRQMTSSLVYLRGGESVLLEGKNLSTMPAWIKAFPKDPLPYKEINLNKNKLRDFPIDICQFQNVERLALGDNQIGVIPEDIRAFKKLLWLDMTHNRISHVSEALGELPSLMSLGISDCRLTHFPIAITRIPKLKKLGLFGNLITSLPKEIGQMQQLTKLDLSNNNLQSIPAEIGLMTNLTWLNVSNNHLTSLPSELGALYKMTELGLAHNKLTFLPDLSAMSNLTLLTAFNNEITTLGPWVTKLLSLQRLDLSSNKLTHLPEGILTLPNLILLNLRGNMLSQLPPPHPRNSNRRPHMLKTLDVRNNMLTTLPYGIFNENLEDVRVAGNAFFTTKISCKSAIPPLQSHALRKVTNEQSSNRRRQLYKVLTPILKARMMEVSEDRIGHHCHICKEHFTSNPLNHLEFFPLNDHPSVPMLMHFCGSGCRQEYLVKTEGFMKNIQETLMAMELEIEAADITERRERNSQVL